MESQYFSLAIFLFVSLAIAGVIIGLPFVLARKKNKSKYKGEPYECGSIPFEDSRKFINFKFYLIAILFVMFEVEMCILFPYVIGFEKMGVAGFIVMLSFMLILALGFFYEWKKGVLDWE